MVISTLFNKKNTIFVAIAAYLDYEIRHTILDCIHKAKFPENLYFGVCLQYDDREGIDKNCIDDLQKKYNIKIVKYHHTQSMGGCWARNLAQKLHGNQKYTLQVDSHTRFIQHWDELVINDFLLLKDSGVKKPVISFLPPHYFRNDSRGIDYQFDQLESLDKINIPLFRDITDEYWPVYGGYSNVRSTEFKPVNVKILYGGFIFSEIKWIKEIEQDPEHYYTGEEFALAIRSYTHGYDIYTPSHVIAWHRCHFIPLPKHYTNNPEQIGSSMHRKAMVRLKYLIEGTGDLGKYSIGKERTIEDYGKFAGIDFKSKKLL